MIKLFKQNQLQVRQQYTKEVIKNAKETIEILNKNYGESRNVDDDLGGYICIVENIIDIEILKQDKLKALIPEYTDLIECKEGVNYTSSLFLLSSDFSIVVITTEELTKVLLDNGKEEIND